MEIIYLVPENTVAKLNDDFIKEKEGNSNKHNIILCFKDLPKELPKSQFSEEWKTIYQYLLKLDNN
jgi:hypothetical protein